MLEITSDQKDAAEAALIAHNNGNQGELYNLKFQKLDEVLKLGNLNAPTIESLKKFKNRLNQSNQSNQSNKTPKKYEAKGGYYQKYLKYKLKYLALKKQLGQI